MFGRIVRREDVKSNDAQNNCMQKNDVLNNVAQNTDGDPEDQGMMRSGGRQATMVKNTYKLYKENKLHKGDGAFQKAVSKNMKNDERKDENNDGVDMDEKKNGASSSESSNCGCFGCGNRERGRSICRLFRRIGHRVRRARRVAGCRIRRALNGARSKATNIPTPECTVSSKSLRLPTATGFPAGSQAGYRARPHSGSHTGFHTGSSDGPNVPSSVSSSCFGVGGHSANSVPNVVE